MCGGVGASHMEHKNPEYIAKDNSVKLARSIVLCPKNLMLLETCRLAASSKELWGLPYSHTAKHVKTYEVRDQTQFRYMQGIYLC